MSCNLLYYFVHLDAKDHPIPGTMFSSKQAKSNPCTTNIARLTGQVMIPPAGQVQCVPTNGIRYWYQVKSVPTGAGNSRTDIVPNSMIAVKGVPKEITGTGNAGVNGPGAPCNYVEYKIFKTQDGL